MKHTLPMTTEMTRAILNTRVGSWPPAPIDPEKPTKGRTMRVMKPQPENDGNAISWRRRGDWHLYVGMKKEAVLDDLASYAPHQPGDVVGFKEAIERGPWGHAFYVSDGLLCLTPGRNPTSKVVDWTWKPAKLPGLHMPHNLIRLTGEVLRVTVARPCDLGPDAIQNEGCPPFVGLAHGIGDAQRIWWENLLHSQNPKDPDIMTRWCWVYEFVRRS